MGVGVQVPPRTQFVSYTYSQLYLNSVVVDLLCLLMSIGHRVVVLPREERCHTGTAQGLMDPRGSRPRNGASSHFRKGGHLDMSGCREWRGSSYAVDINFSRLRQLSSIEWADASAHAASCWSTKWSGRPR